MKKLVLASLISASLLGVNFNSAEASTFDSEIAVKQVSEVKTFTSLGELQDFLDRYFNGEVTFKSPEQNQSQPEENQQEQEPSEPAQNNSNQESNPAPNNETEAKAKAGLSAQEQQMVNLVNEERQRQGLAPLEVDMELTEVARVKAKDMIDNNYFSHQSPTYGSPFDMMKQFGISYRTAGENLAGNSSVEGAHTGLMNSDGHRANILNENFTNVGIGIVDGGPYGKMYVQLFKG
jgi:uncharacterized YkwD family protein